MTPKKQRTVPPLPPRVKARAIYRSADYINVIAYDKDKVSFYLWDGESKSYNHILQFPIAYGFRLPTTKKQP